MVLETLKPLPQDRKCFRMINGVLVERTVKEVVPALETNSEGLKKVLEELVKQYKRQEQEMDKWKASAIILPYVSFQVQCRYLDRMASAMKINTQPHAVLMVLCFALAMYPTPLPPILISVIAYFDCFASSSRTKY